MKKSNTNVYLLYDRQWNPEIKNWDGGVVYIGISSVPHQAIKKQKASGASLSITDYMVIFLALVLILKIQKRERNDEKKNTLQS